MTKFDGMCQCQANPWERHGQSAAERESLLALPDTKDDLILHYTFSETDLSIIRQRRGPANRLGFAIQLCYLRFPGDILGADEPPFPPLLKLVADQIAMILPHVKITELLLEVDEWTGFTRHFTHLKSGNLSKDKNLLLTTILADAINLGLTKMAESCPGTSYAKLAWLQAWHISDETYGAAPRHRRTVRISAPVARSRAPVTSTRNTAAAQAGRFI